MCVRCYCDSDNRFCDLCIETIEQQINCYDTCGDFCTAWRGFYNEQPTSCDNAEWLWQKLEDEKIEAYVTCQGVNSPVYCIQDWLNGDLQCRCVSSVTYIKHDKQNYVLMLNTEKLIKNANFTC